MYTEKELNFAHRAGLMIGGLIGFGSAIIFCLVVGALVT